MKKQGIEFTILKGKPTTPSKPHPEDADKKPEHPKVQFGQRPMFTLSAAAQIIIKRLREMEFGEDVSYEELSEICGGNVQKEKRGSMTSARRILLKEGYVFDAVMNKGLRRLYPVEIAETTPRLVRRVKRATAKHLLELGTADLSTMTAEEQKHHGASMLQATLIAASVDIETQKKVAYVALPTPQMTFDRDAVRRIYG